ncbi:21282_t:CDS:2, partial [Cetraspora pellucida]
EMRLCIKRMRTRERTKGYKRIKKTVARREENKTKETSKYVINSKEQALRKLLKPVFIPKVYRKTILEKKRMKKLEEAKRMLELKKINKKVMFDSY